MNTFKIFALAAFAAGCACAAEPLRFDAEKVAVDPSAFTQDNNRPPVGKWDFWTKDRPDNIWLNKSTLRAPLCKTDRAPEDPASGLFRVRLPLADGYYRIEARGGRAFGVAVGNGAFKKIEFRGVVADRVEVKGGFLELRVANCYATPSNPGWVYVDHFIAIPLGAGKPDAKKAETRKWSKVYEAEDVAVEKDKIVSGDRMVSGKWNLWANDPLKKRWSGEKALRGDVIRANRKVADPAAAILTFRVPVPKNVPCDIRFFGGRTVGVSFDGKFFRRLTNDTLLAGEIKSETGFVEFQIANCYAEDNPKHAGSPYIDRFVVTPTKNVTGFPPMLSPEPKVNYYKYSDRYFRVEAEDVAVEKDKIASGDRMVPGKWNLWANDPWKHKWSGGKVLRSMPVMKDCSPEAPDAAKLTIRIPVKLPGKYRVQAFGGRAFGVSVDGKKFRLIDIRGEVAPEIEAKDGFLTFCVAACYADPNPKNRGSAYLDNFLVTKLEDRAPNPKLPVPAGARVEEKLDRGAVAALTADGMLVSWRLLKEDSADIAFNVFRTRDGKQVKLNSAPVVQTCDWLDADGRVTDRYRVEPAGKRGLAGDAVMFPAPSRPGLLPYLSFKLSDPEAMVQNVGIGDLNGDGKYDFVVKTPRAVNIDPYPLFWYPSPTTFKLEAFLSDGTRLWTYDMGPGIERGVWYSPAIIYDFDGDGKAEVVVKAAEGDPRDPDGRVTSGPEYFAVLDGMTGKVIAKAPWPSRDNFESYNFFSRNQLAMAYLDGKTPAIIALRGTYGTMKAEAWQLKDGKLVNLWKFDNTGMPLRFQRQGAHATICADFDNDGRDEILLGSMVIDDNGEVLWSNGRGHPDYIYYTDIIASHPGPELAHFYEDPQTSGGVLIADPATGKTLWKLNEPNKHINDAYVIDFDPTIPGPEIGAIDFNVRAPSPDRRWLFSADGRLLKKGRGVGGMRRGIFWDADLEKEECLNSIRDFNGGPVGGSFAGTRLMVCDLFGDWREEVITTVPGELRVYTTPIPAMDRRVTLVQNPGYRNNIVNDMQGYYSDAQLPYTPTTESDNLSLIVRTEPGVKPYLQLTVSASRHAPLDGKLVLFPPAGITVPENEWNVSLKPGEICVKNFALPDTLPERVTVRAELRTKDKTLRGRVLVVLPRKVAFPDGTIRIPAANFSAERGGKVRIVKGRPTAHDGTLVAWDKKGHAIDWKFTVSKPGRYELRLHRSSPAEAMRSILCDGKAVGEVYLEPTGGMGFAAADWEVEAVKTAAGSVILDLAAGEHTLTMINLDGAMQNLAYLYLIPAGKEGGRK